MRTAASLRRLRFAATSTVRVGLAGSILAIWAGHGVVLAEDPKPQGARSAATPKPVEARIDGAWAALRGEFDPSHDDDGPRATVAIPVGGPAAAGASEAVDPLAARPEAPAPSTAAAPFAAPAIPGGPEGAAIGYAPESGATASPVDRVFAAEPQRIAVPLPRKRPTEPIVAARVAALDAAAAVGRPDKPVEVAPILAEDGVFGPPKKIPKQALPYLHILEREAAKNKVPLWLVIGVGYVESKYDPKLRGSHSVLGIMQVMPSTARYQGYKGTTEQLLDPETNIVWGVKELGWDWAAAKGDACLAIAKYKGGIATKSIPAAAWNYCMAAKKVTGMM